MTNYAERDAMKAATIAKLNAVVRVGAELKYWIPVSNNAPKLGDEFPISNHGYHVVMTPAGHFFSLSGGGYAEENKISCALTGRDESGIKVLLSDVTGRGDVLACASCSSTRPPEIIAHSLFKRVMESPVNLKIAQWVNELLSKRTANHDALFEYVAILKEQGYTFPKLVASEYYKATGWKPHGKPNDITVNCYGVVSFTMEISVPVNGFADMVKSLNAASDVGTPLNGKVTA